MSHTATPWEQSSMAGGDAQVGVGVGDQWIAEFRSEEDASFAVRAVNSHADLLAALLDQTCTGCDIRLDTPSDFPCTFCLDARAAIAKAK